jgi:hypothetical protein
MKSPYVCAGCGRSIQLGRHRSGWRHSVDKHPDHRVQAITRDEYEQSKDKGQLPSRVPPEKRHLLKR